MLSMAQIKKMQKRVGKVVDANIAKREEEIKKKKDEDKLLQQKIFEETVLPELKIIRNTCSTFQKKYPNRGICFCIWNNKVYIVRDNKAVVEKMFTKNDILTAEENKTFVCIKKYDDGKSYYMIDEKIAEEEKKIHDWMTENYAKFKFANVKIKNAGGKLTPENLAEVSILGSLSIEFTEKFPGKTPLDLIELFKIYDELIMNDLQKMSEKTADILEKDDEALNESIHTHNNQSHGDCTYPNCGKCERRNIMFDD